LITLGAGALTEKSKWEHIGVTLPGFDRPAMLAQTMEAPVWLHFGAGNIFRGFIARLQQELLNQGISKAGIIVADTFDYEIIDRIYRPYDNLTIMADLGASGEVTYEIIGSVAEALCANANDQSQMLRLREIATSPSLQLISFTITEKGYALHGMNGALLPMVEQDILLGPQKATHAMSIVCALLYERYNRSAAPLAIASMDNCSHNGDRLCESILEIARYWVRQGFMEMDFLDYLLDQSKISFPWSMIDKITPRPSESICEKLTSLGIAKMSPITTSKGTYIAPFVNAEIPQYLVIEDKFPNGRPLFEKAGVYMTDRDTVNKAERMKVTTCLNPLHTSLAIFGCLLGFTRISDEMQDPDLSALVNKIGFEEGLPVVTDPIIMNPKVFLCEVINERLPNPYIPDMPQRIATDTSQKLAIRFGETIKAYVADDRLDATQLTFIPLTIAAWLRYLLGIDDFGEPMSVSPDPLLGQLTEQLEGVNFGTPASCKGKLSWILENETLFGIDLVACGLSAKIEDMVSQMLEGKGAVRETLSKYLNNKQAANMLKC
jgi:fructuronate reductase